MSVKVRKTEGKNSEPSSEMDVSDGENMAAWLMSVDILKIQPFKLPSLSPHDARIRMKAVGICGSDVHYLKVCVCEQFKIYIDLI